MALRRRRSPLSDSFRLVTCSPALRLPPSSAALSMAAISASASSSAAALLAAFALLLVVLEAPGAVGAPLKLTAFSSRGYPEFGERVLEALPEWPVTHHARVATSLDPETPELPIAARGPLYYPSSPPPAPAPAPAHHELPSEASETATGGAGSGNVKTAA